jgi:histidine triad (HIT) family protein
VSECLFCRIVAGEIPADIIYSDDEILAFKDINPVAPIHILIIPKIHITSLADVKENDVSLIGRIMGRISLIAKEHCPDDNYRVVTNVGENAGQTVPHLHFHLLGGRKFD